MTELTTTSGPSGEFERIERFQSLEAGQYAKAREADTSKGILADDCLLILSIDWVDGQAHTITLRAHPRNYGDWNQKYQYRIADFLDKFEHEPDAERIRAREIQEAQGRVFALQQELMEAQSDPEKMQRIVAEGLAAEAGKKSGQNPDMLPALITPDTPPPLDLGSALTRGVSETSIKALKSQAEHHLAVVTVQKNWITAKSNEIANALKAMTPYFEEKGAAVLAQTEDMRRYIEKVVDGIASLELYVGTGVYVERVKEGVSAPESVPLSIMQSKLIMVEELAVWADVYPSTDAQALGKFVELLAAEPGFVEQIFPTQRCVLCMASNRHNVQYADSLTSVIRNQQNKEVFLLVRNGENIHMVMSPVESHLGADRLFPTLDEVDGVFRGFDGSQITFDSLQYTKSLKVFERQALHYKRLLILLCGLDHRLNLFGDFYREAQSLNFVSLAFQERYFNFIRDDDPAAMIEGGEQFEPVRTWFRRMNSFMASGSRLLGIWGEVIDENSAPGATRLNANYRGEPDVRIVYRDGKSLCVDVPVRSFHETRSTNAKVTPLLRERGSRSDFVPYLVLDAVKVEELKRYIYDRKSRVHHLTYLRMFKQALKYLERESVEEAASRAHLRSALIAGAVVADSEADHVVADAVRLWRAANRGQVLPHLDYGDDTPEWAALLQLMYLLAHAGRDQLHRVESFCGERGIEPLRLVVTGKGQLILYAAPHDSERDDRLTPHAWVHRIVLRLGKQVVSELNRTWAVLPKQSASERTVCEYDAASAWLEIYSGFESLEQKCAALEKCEAGVEYLRRLVTSPDAVADLAAAYLKLRPDLTKRGKRSSSVVSPTITLPLGVTWGRMEDGKQGLYCLGLRVSDGPRLIAALSPTKEFRAAFRDGYVSIYQNKKANGDEFDQYPKRETVAQCFEIALMPLTSLLKLDEVPLHAWQKIEWYSTGYRYKSNVPSMDRKLGGYIENFAARQKVWLAGGLSSVGPVGLDGLFGIEQEVMRYQPGRMTTITFSPDHQGNNPVYAEVVVAQAELVQFPKISFAGNWSAGGGSTDHWLLPEELEQKKAELDAKPEFIRGDNLPAGMPRLEDEALGCWYRLFKPGLVG